MSSKSNTAEIVDLNHRFTLSSEGAKDPFDIAFKLIEPDMLRKMGIHPFHLPIDRNDGPTALINNRETIMLGSNNYLGLTIHPEVRKAAADAIMKHGTSMTGSRLLNGTHVMHLELEEALAKYFGKEAGVVFGTGYQANLGVLSSFFKKGTALILDEKVHASIHDGSKLGKGEKFSFKHNDMADLRALLTSLPADMGKMIMVDGVYSMEGDVAPLDEIAALAKEFEARLILDDAHGVGLLGQGKGTAFEYDVASDVDLIVGTFSKTLASVGGFAVGQHKVIDYIKHIGRPMLFSASLPPASAASALKALEIMQREPERVQRLNHNAAYMRKALKEMGFDIGHSTTAIIPIVVGDEIKCLTIWRELLDEGVYVNAVPFPAVPVGQAVLRTSYTSEHTREHLDRSLEIFAKLKKKHSW
jgi:8-amino-7-oxononanoate synthase